MNKQQAVKQNSRSIKYLQQNKLRPFFYQLTKLILLKKPQDPIQFLIEYLQKRNKRQVICLQGYDEQNRVKLAKNIANKFNYKIIQLAELFKGVTDWNSKPDKEINDKLMAELNKVQSLYKGIVISGYPNNIIQADFIQKSGVLPQRYFLMANEEQTIRKSYNQKYSGNIDDLLGRNKLELKQLNEILGDLVDNLPKQFDKASQKAIQTISLKGNKKTSPYDSPRVLVLHPPYLKPTCSNIFIDNFSLNPISINSTLKKLQNKQGFITHVQSYIRKNKRISKQIQLAMIETMTKNAPSKNKGFVLYGWPQNKDRIALLKQHYLNPHLILIFEQSKQECLKLFEALNQNDADTFSIIKKPTKQQYSVLYNEYMEMADLLRGKINVQTFSVDESGDKVIKAFVNLMDNPNIYS